MAQMTRPHRRRFKDPEHQELYDKLRAAPPLADFVRGQGASMNAYAVGRTSPDQPLRIARRGSRAYAAWAAGVDAARVLTDER